MARARKPKIVPIGELTCDVHVSRGGVQIGLGGIPLGQAVDVACYILKGLEEKRGAFPELHAPYTVEQIGGYTPVDTSDDDTWARRQVGF